MNRIIKSTMCLLLNLIFLKTKKNYGNYWFFNEVECIDLNKVNWKFQYNRNNQSYRMMISICYLVVKEQTTSDGQMKLMDFLDEQRMSRLYEKFILEYYKKHCPKLNANASQIPWARRRGW